jgi:hypothetical protein
MASVKIINGAIAPDQATALAAFGPEPLGIVSHEPSSRTGRDGLERGHPERSSGGCGCQRGERLRVHLRDHLLVHGLCDHQHQRLTDHPILIDPRIVIHALELS